MDRRALVIGALVLAACSRQQAKTPESDTSASAGPDPADAIRAIYAPYMEQGGAPRLLDAAPWSTDLRARLAAGQSQAPLLDFDPIVNAQDYELSALAVTTEGIVAGSHATVRAHFVNLGSEDEVLFDVVWEGGAWRVDNIRTAAWDLRQIAGQTAPPR